MKTLLISTIAATVLATSGAFANELTARKDLANIGSTHGLVTEKTDRTNRPDAALQQTRDYTERAFIKAKSAQEFKADGASSKAYGFTFGTINIAPEYTN